jgi:hypothetical protein
MSMGCTAKRGTISLETRPPGATVFVDGVRQGVTPLGFTYDAGRRGTLKIEKEGYYTETEQLDKRWFVNEHYKGNFDKRYKGGESSERVWEVRTTRDLKEKKE